MASTLSSWYHNQYAAWNRTRRLQASPFLARTDSRVGRLADHPPAGDTVIHMGELLPPLSTDRSQQAGEKKRQDTLFGPSIGIVNPGPDWADHNRSEKDQPQDVLTPELVKNWVEKSKEASQPTTTLQALVNLKRPSLRLSPISQDGPETDVPQQHGLEFQFDCDAPKCRITVHIVSTLSQDTTTAGTSSSLPLLEIFHTVVDGGFGRVLKLEEGAILELDKYDPASQPNVQPPSPPPIEVPSSVPEPSTVPENPPPPKKRFTLRIRRRTHPNGPDNANRVSVAGPALQVVDAESPAEGPPIANNDKDEGGVKVLISLEALDVNEHTLVSPNAQATYLHIVRLGPAPAVGTADTRPWVVRVVKREATIGPHTFHLHEIYGLSSHAATADANSHAALSNPAIPPDSDDPTSECLLCLSSPREVVLLPCRHLVACKECAVNMVEFGAGGQLVHTEDATVAENANATNPATTAGATETAGEGSGAPADGEAGAASAAAPAPPAPTPTRPNNPRRKRKAKGWFCPVCRQPYTSLLRISTVAPGKVASTKIVESDETVGSERNSAMITTPPQEQTQTARSGILRVLSSTAARVAGLEHDTSGGGGTHNVENDSSNRETVPV